MKTVLQQINLIPEVIGSMIIDADGRPIFHELPALLDDKTLQVAGSIISENIEGLRMATADVSLLDFRFQSKRIVVRSMNGAFLLLLCTPAVNMPLLNISLNVSVRRLEKLLIQHTQALKALEEARKLENLNKTEAPPPPPPAAPPKAKKVVAFSI